MTEVILVDPKYPAVKFGPFGRRSENDQCWKTFEALHVIWIDGEQKFDFTVPKGFLNDMGSVPRGLWWYIPPTGPGNIGFIAHDYAYSDHPGPIDQNGVEMTREQADAMMKDLLEYGGMRADRRFVAWRGVRRGGWLSWKKEPPKYMVGKKKRRMLDG